MKVARKDAQSRKIEEIRNSEDAEFLDIWKLCQPYTMTSLERGLALFRTVKYICNFNIPGVFVECGVWKGGSAMIMLKTLQHMGQDQRRVVLFDTFSGMTEAGMVDVDHQGVSAQDQLLEAKIEKSTAPIWAYADIKEVKKNIDLTGYDRDLIRFVQGDVRKTLNNTNLGKIALLRLDTDFYDSTKAELEILYPKLGRHGALIIDDYGHWRGARRAVDEYFQENDPHYFHRIDYTGRLLIKTENLSAHRGSLDVQRGQYKDENRYDYCSDGLVKIDLLSYYPMAKEGRVAEVKWPWLRKKIPQKWRVDIRSVPINIGLLSVDEAILLYNLALQFKGLRALEIGCHYGWSSGHLISAGVVLDIIDPLLSRSDQYNAVEQALSDISKGHKCFDLWPGFSPGLLKGVRNSATNPWSFVFVDGNHEGDAPFLDAMEVSKYCADDAMVVFHDLASPHVAEGLRYFKKSGWNIKIYDTMQIMGVAWRGNCTPVTHYKDDAITEPLPGHLTDLLEQ